MNSHGNGTRTVGRTAFRAILPVIALLLFAALCILSASASDITPDDTFEVTETLIGIEVVSEPLKTIYDIGEALDASGLRIKLKYNSGRTEIADGDVSMCSGFDSSSPGAQTVTVSYRGFTASFKVNVRIVTSVSVASKPRKTEYFVGEALDLDGLTLTVEYSAGPSETLDSGYALVEGSRLDTAGEHTVTVECMGKRVSFTVTVKPPAPIGAKLTSLPAKTEYTVGDAFDGSGAAFTVTYSDGKTAVVSDGIEFSGFSSAAKGEVSVTAKWQSFTDTFTVTIKYAAHTHVPGGDREIIRQPTCTETGFAVRYCKICGEIAESATLNKLEHTYGEWTVTKEPTADSEGEKKCTCEKCGDIRTAVLSRLSSELSDGTNGSVTAADNYLFPSGSLLTIKDVSETLTADETQKLSAQAKALGMSLIGVYDVGFETDGQAFTPSAKMTVRIRADIPQEMSDIKVICGDSAIDAEYSGGYVVFTVNRAFSRFAIAGVGEPAATTAPDATSDTSAATSPGTSAGTPTTASPDTPDNTSCPEVSVNDPADSDAPEPDTSTNAPVTSGTADAVSGGGKPGKAIKAIIIIIIVIAVTGALFELLYIYLKNKFMV